MPPDSRDRPAGDGPVSGDQQGRDQSPSYVATPTQDEQTAPAELIPLARFDWERIIRRVGIHPAAKLVALTLATFASKDGGQVRPGTGRIVRVTGYSKSTVGRQMIYLRELGLIERVVWGDRHRGLADQYRLTVPADLGSRVSILDPDDADGERGVSDVQASPVTPRAEVQASPMTPKPGAAKDVQASPMTPKPANPEMSGRHPDNVWASSEQCLGVTHDAAPDHDQPISPTKDMSNVALVDAREADRDKVEDQADDRSMVDGASALLSQLNTEHSTAPNRPARQRGDSAQPIDACAGCGSSRAAPRGERTITTPIGVMPCDVCRPDEAARTQRRIARNTQVRAS